MPTGVYERQEKGTVELIRRVIESLEVGDTVTAKMVAELAGGGVGRREAAYVLRKERDKGVVRRVGAKVWLRVHPQPQPCSQAVPETNSKTDPAPPVPKPSAYTLLKGPVGDLLWVLTEYIPELERRVEEAEADARQCRDQMQKMSSVFQAATTVRDRVRVAGVMAVAGD